MKAIINNSAIEKLLKMHKVSVVIVKMLINQTSDQCKTQFVFNNQ